MTIKDEVLKVIVGSPTALFAEDISHRMPHAKLATIKSSCWALADEGKVKVKKKDRQDAKISHVFYVREDQIAGMEGLMDYERRTIGPRHKEEPTVEEVMIAIPLAEGKTDLVTIEQARKIYRQLTPIFGKGGA